MADARLDVIINAARAISGAAKVKTALRSIATEASSVERALNKLKGSSIALKLDAKKLTAVKTAVQEVDKALRALSTVSVKPKVDLTGVDKLSKSVASAKTAFTQLSGLSAKPRVDLSGITGVAQAVATATTSLKTISSLSLRPKIDLTGLDRVSALVNTARASMTSLSTMVVKPRIELAGLAQVEQLVGGVKTSLKSISTLSVKPSIDLTGLSRVSKAVSQAMASLKTLSVLVVKPKIDLSALAQVPKSVAAAIASLRSITTVSIRPKVDLSSVERVSTVVATAAASLKSLSAVSIKPVVDLSALDRIPSAVASARQALTTLSSIVITPRVDAASFAQLTRVADELRASLKALSALSITPKVSLSGLGGIAQSVAKAQASLKTLSALTIKPKVDASALVKLTTGSAKALTALRTITSLTVKPAVNLTGLAALTRAAGVASATLKTLSTQVLAPKASVTNLTKLSDAAKATKKSLDAIKSIRINPVVSVASLNKLTLAAAKAQKTLKSISGDAISIKASITGLTKLTETVTQIKTALNSISSTVVIPKVDASAINALRTKITNISQGLAGISRTTVRPRSNLRGIEKIIIAAKTAKTALDKINSTRISPQFNASQLTGFTRLSTEIDRQINNINRKTVSPKVNLTELGRLSSRLTTIIAQLNSVGKASSGFGAAVANSAKQGATGLNSMATAARNAQTQLNAVAKASAAIKPPKTGGGGAGVAGVNFSSSIKQAGLYGISIGGATNALSKLGGVLGIVTGGLAATTLSFADASTQIENKVRLVTGSLNELNIVQAELFNQSQDARVAFGAQADLYQRIGLSAKELGVSSSEIIVATEGVAKAITLSAASAQAANATVIQFGQALAYGKLRGDELRSVLEQSPRLAQALADGLGIARGELIKFGFEGNLTSDIVFKALLSQVPKLREEFATLTPRISEAGTVMANAFIKFGGAFNDVSGVADSSAKAIISMAKSTNDSIPAMIAVVTDFKLAWVQLLEVLGPVPTVLGAIYDGAIALGNGIIAGYAGLLDMASMSPFEDTFEDLGDLTVELSNLSKLQNKLQGDIDSFNAAKATGAFREAINGLPNRVDIDLRVNAEKAEKELPALKAKIASLSDKAVLLNVVVNFEDAEKRLLAMNKELGSLTSRTSPEKVKELQTEFKLLNDAINTVKANGSELIPTTDKERQQLEFFRKELAAIQKAFPLQISTSVNAVGFKEGDLQAIQDVAAARAKAAKAVGDYLSKQNELIAQTNVLSEAESDLNMLRLEAGKGAVDNISKLIEANKAYISSQERLGEFEEDATKQLETLKDQLAATSELSKAEQLRAEIAKLDVLTPAEEKRADVLREQLIALNNTTDGTKNLKDITLLLAEAQLLAGKITPDQYARLQLLADETERTEELITASKELAEARKVEQKQTEDAIQSAKSRVSRGTDDSRVASIKSDINEIDTVVARLEAIDPVDRTADQAENLKSLKEAKVLMIQDVVDIGDSIKEVMTDAEKFTKAVVDAMSDAFSDVLFAGIQGDWDKINSDMLQTFQNTMDRMVADALSRKLTEAVFGGVMGIGGGIASLFSGFGGGGAAPAGSIAAPTAQQLSGPFEKGGFAPPNTRTEVNEMGRQEMLTLNNKSMLIPLPSEGSEFKPIGSREQGGFMTPRSFVEVNERGQEMLTLGGKQMLIPDNLKDISREKPPEVVTRGMESGGFARPNERVEVNEKARELAKPPRLASMDIAAKGLNDPTVIHEGGRTFMQMGASGGFVLPAEKTRETLQKSISTGKVPNREFGGAVQSRSIFEVNEGVMPELLSIGSRDFLMTGGASGHVTPMDSTSQLGRSVTVNMTVVTPDVDGFRKTQGQIQNDLTRLGTESNRRNG